MSINLMAVEITLERRADSTKDIAFSREETRPFNVVADDPNGVTCVVLDRQSYRELIADELTRLKRQESFRAAPKKYISISKNLPLQYSLLVWMTNVICKLYVWQIWK